MQVFRLGLLATRRSVNLESLPETISPSTRIGPDPRWLAGTLGVSHSTAPFRNRSEAFDTYGPS